MFNKEVLENIEKKIVVTNDPFPNSIINNFLPIDTIQEVEKEFID